ncbi:MAG: DUF2147 domain-containing protein, partial [Verrucomicrobia bacterium]|nr:DUF2147 domain-containing protein [Verrucomicrobiota bacterium]
MSLLKSTLFSFFILWNLSVIGEGIEGFWETLNDHTKKPSSIIAIYPYQGKFYGRIIGTYNDQGVLDDTIYDPKARASNIVGHPYYSGLDIIWEATLEEDGKYKGRIIDPEKGEIYELQIWRKGGNISLYGDFSIFGESKTWPP